MFLGRAPRVGRPEKRFQRSKDDTLTLEVVYEDGNDRANPCIKQEV
jgi:hypothetical protein